MKDKFSDLLIKVVIQEIVKNHVNDALESIGVKSKINFLIHPEATSELNIGELLEKFLTKTKITMEAKKILRRRRQNIIEERDSGKCDICRSSKNLKPKHQINLR